MSSDDRWCRATGWIPDEQLRARRDAEADEAAHRRTEDATAKRIAEWLRKTADVYERAGMGMEILAPVLRARADLCERGEWRKP